MDPSVTYLGGYESIMLIFPKTIIGERSFKRKLPGGFPKLNVNLCENFPISYFLSEAAICSLN